VTSAHDPIDDWLGTEVTPLSPPPGSLARIRQRARRRKNRQATFVAVGCAVVLAAGVATPQVISALNHRPRHHAPTIAIGSSPPGVTTSPSPTKSSRNAPTPDATKATQMAQRTYLSTTTSGTVPPGNFRPTSVTFVGNGTGGVVGAVIGQALTPGHCATRFCTSLAGTSTYGASWYGFSAPLAPGPSSSGTSGVSQLRFATLHDGWAYGPALEETSDGGWPWHREDTHGQRVLDVESTPTRAFAVFGTCYGTGADYAASCSSFSLWTSLPGTRTWRQVSVPSAYDQMKSTSSAAPLLVMSGGTTGYLITPSGEVLSGPATAAGGPWSAVGVAKCKPGSPSTSGQGAQPTAQLAVGPKLVLACDTPAAHGRFTAAIYTSANGATWNSAGSVTFKGTPTSQASASAPSASSGVVVLATTHGIEYSANGGQSWQAATVAGGVPAGGFSYVGMTTPKDGVAIPANPSPAGIYITVDGGQTWQQSPITG
jgi:hypothetical protein